MVRRPTLHTAMATATLVAILAIGVVALAAGRAQPNAGAAPAGQGSSHEPTLLVAGGGAWPSSAGDTGPGSSADVPWAGVVGPGSDMALPWPSAPAPSTGPVAGTIAWRVPLAWHVPVLMYHVIATAAQAGRDLPGLVVSPTLFRDQLRAAFLAGWRTITASQLARDMAAGRQPPPRTFVITIDDGHQDGWTEAYPILQTFGFVATFFVPTERIDRPGNLTSPEVIALSNAGMEIANHSVDHVPLAHLGPRELRFQIFHAQAAIAALLGAPALTLAYPLGNRDQRVIDDVAAAGIGLAFSTVGGCSETLGARLDEPRLRVSPWTTPADLLTKLGRCAAMPAWG